MCECFAQFFPSAWETIVEFIPPQQINKSIGFDKSRCMRKLVVCMFATLYSLRHRSGTDPGAKVWFIYWFHRYWVSATTVLIRVNLNTLKTSCSVEVWDHICLYISPILYHIYPLANLPSAHQCMPPICPTPYIKFHLQFWGALRTSERIRRLDYIALSNILCLYSISFRLWNLDKILNYRLSLFVLLVVWCARGERCLFNPTSARLYFNYIQADVVNSIIIYTLFVILSLKIARISYTID